VSTQLLRQLLRRRRAAVLAPAGLLLAVLALVPAVTTAAGQQGRQDTLDVCHSLDDGRYEARQARETDFYGAGQQDHGTHQDDIAPPFVVEDPRPGDPSSFPGRNWDDRGRSVYDNACAAPEPLAKSVRICHATSSAGNPYVSQSPAIANNGDLQGGHLNHTGPVYPQPGWGDIIPPYEYVDANGDTQVFPGHNWTEQGQAIWQNGCEPPAPPGPRPITPVLECIEALDGGFLAHFGYDNPNATSVEPPTDQNTFLPPPANRGQPTAFAPGRVEDAFQVEFQGGSLTWSLTGNRLTVSADSRPCQGSITVTKRLVPSGDPGRFNLEIDGQVAGGASAVGDGGTTGTIAVTAGRHRGRGRAVGRRRRPQR
jgi:hypothetical protein